MESACLSEQREIIALASLETEIARQRYLFFDNLNEELTKKQQERKYHALNNYLGSVLKERILIAEYKEAANTGCYDSRYEELEREKESLFNYLERAT